jgi:hypothetical protein
VVRVAVGLLGWVAVPDALRVSSAPTAVMWSPSGDDAQSHDHWSRRDRVVSFDNGAGTKAALPEGVRAAIADLAGG